MKKVYTQPQFVAVNQMSVKPHVYCIMNKINGKIYVGVHKGTDTANYLGSGRFITQAIKKHGKENFVKTIIAEFDNETDAYKLEGEIVTKEFLKGNVYNMIEGGRNSAANLAKACRKKAVITRKLRGSYRFINQKKAQETQRNNGYKAQSNAGKAGQKVIKENNLSSFYNPEQREVARQKGYNVRKELGWPGGSKQKSICPHCNKEGNKMAMARWHFDNCKLNPQFIKKDNAAQYINSVAKKTVICPHCNKEGNAMAMKRWHFDNCKKKLDNQYTPLE